MRSSHDLQVCENVTELLHELHKIDLTTACKRRAKTHYVDCTCTFDIETTNTEDDGFLWAGQCNIAGINFTFRYIEGFLELCDYLIAYFGLYQDLRLVFYVHNLGYETFYLLQRFTKEWGEPNLLLTDSHKPLYIRFSNGIEFRDSLKLFQKSLARATEGLPHAKLVGDLDYTVYRTPDTPETQEEFDYRINDVQGLYEAIEKLKHDYNYNQATIPYTNTGRVIEAVNKRCEKDGKTLRAMRETALDKTQLELAYKCMAGGDTHGTRWRAGITYYNCNSYDLKSAHPSQQLLDRFPMGKPITLDGEQVESTLRRYMKMGYGWIGQVFIRDLQILPQCPDPTISVTKVSEIVGQRGVDNGRLLGADGVIVYMDSNDYIRFIEGYTYAELIGLQVVVFPLHPLPETFRGAIFEFFEKKETYAKDDPERDFSKICVNTIFGACAQKVIRDEYSYIDPELHAEKTKWVDNLRQKNEEEVLKAELNKLPFLWGLWTASLSRLKLWNLIKQVGWEKVIYWDTDSCKFEGEKVQEVDTIYNERVRQQCRNRNCVVTKDTGESVYIGIAEDEHPTVPYGYRAFRFLHAKCYATESWSDKKQTYVFETTIAGVHKEKGVKALGGVDNLKDNFYIADAGGQKLSYNHRPLLTRNDWSMPTTTASYIYMQPRDYRISFQSEKFEEEIC